MTERVTILSGDCLKVLPTLEAESVDAVICDPPYGLAFMGKDWDHGVPGEHFWREAIRVAKPGAHLLAFGGTRMFHRLAVAIEDAGWEIRDTVMWVYSSGFPKSKNLDGDWQGWGTALKPAWEPIIVARKPLTGTVADNVLKHGTGAMNIDGCRVAFAGSADEAESKNKNQHAQFGSGPMTNKVFGKYTKDRDDYNPPGRWPANLIHDGSDEVAGLFPVTHGHGSSRHSGSGKGIFNWGTAERPQTGGESGSAARFFYCAKSSKSDRGQGNNHPTVKPTDLMRYLCRLVTPPGGVVLDPFMGSGSTGRAAVLEGFRFIGIEREAEYIEIARARIHGASEHPKQAVLL